MVNRAIKFRVWNGAQKKWQHGPGQECNLFGEMILLGGFMQVNLEELNDCVACQYTGVKDVDGKEIYEGDYVTLEYANFPREANPRNVFEIMFEHGSFIIQPRKLSKGGTLFFDWSKYIEGFDKHGDTMYRYELPPARSIYEFHICRVVGNIFENPELLRS